MQKNEVSISGVGGIKLAVDRTGFLQDFFRVYANSNMKANVLCFADMEGEFEVSYIPKESVAIHLLERGIR
jgi:hypothetical protein